MHVTIDPTTIIVLCIAQTSQDKAISAAQQIMDLKLANGPMAKALEDLLPYWDQHDLSCIPKAKLCLAQMQKDPVPFHPGHSIISLHTDENIPLEERPAPAGIQQYPYHTNEEQSTRGGTPDTYSTNPNLPTPSTFSNSINVYKQLIALGILTKDDVPQDQIHRRTHNTSIDTLVMTPPLEPHHDVWTTKSTSELHTPSTQEALPLPLPLNIPPKQVVFYELRETNIIGEGPESWRLIQHDIGGNEVLVHAEDFPREFTHTRLDMILQLTLPTTLEVKLQHMHLYLKNTITLYKNIRCTCISKTHSTFYNELYTWAVDLEAQDTLKWDMLWRHSFHETVHAAVMLLKKTEDNPRWGNHYISNYKTPDRLLTIWHIAKDLNDWHAKPTPNDLFAALHKEGTWLIHTSQGEQVIIKEDMEDFDDLIYSIHSNLPIECLAQLHNMLNTKPIEEELEQHLDVFIKDAQFVWQLQHDWDDSTREGGVMLQPWPRQVCIILIYLTTY